MDGCGVMKLFGRKPSQLRADVIHILVSLAAVATIITTIAIGVPQIGAIVGIAGGVTTAINLAVAMLQRADIAKAIDALDDVLEVETET